MDISAEIADITAQAPEWNFAGDCALLALMKRISQNLQERGERTTRNLREFETRVRQADISLSNATNSLRSLQFGQQFVEYRVQEIDDDDFEMPAEKKKKPESPPKSSQEMSKEFLENNLQMFRKNFEPVTIDVPDSDDEDVPVNSTTIFRAKNPYDAIPLPYIIGSKEWQEHKYAGLYDSKESSDDEKSEEFSSSSSDERESASSKTPKPENRLVQPQLSDSSSLASANTEPVAVVSPVKLQIPAPAAPPILAPADHHLRQPAPSRTQPRPIISSQRNPHERDLFAALRQSPPSDDPPSTSSSPRSSPAIGPRGTAAMQASLSSSSSSAAHQPPPRLFDEAVPPQIPRKIDANPSPIKRKPVNLFNDDEFHSLMSEIVDKVQSKTGNNTADARRSNQANKLPEENKPVDQAPKLETLKQINEIVATQPKSKTVNLFEDSPPLSPITTHTPLRDATNDLSRPIFDDGPSPLSVKQRQIPPKEPAKPLPKSLFDDDLEDDFLSSFTAKPKPPEQKLKSSLFDDDDLDIDDIFIKPPAQPNKLSERLVGKTSLFDDDDQDDDVTDLFESKKESTKEKYPPVEKKVETPMPPKKDLFDDIQEEDLFGTPKSKNLFANQSEQPTEETEKLEIVQEETQTAMEIEEEAGVVTPPIEIIEEKSNPQLDALEISAHKAADLFNEDFSDDDSFLSTAKSKSTAAATEISQEIHPQVLEKEIKPQKLPESVLPTPEPTNRTEDESPNKDKVDVMADLFGSPKIGPPISETPPPDDLEHDEDPIISMVADVTNKSPKEEATLIAPEADLDAAQQIMQNYTSLFSEEPPDDSEFFQTLGSSSLSSLSASKMFEHDQDFFEPALPKIPVANKSSAPTSSDHGPIGLFSDVPPDDDEDAAEAQKKAAAQPVDVPSTTTRIHTIFYDDFSETARAGAVGQTSKSPILEEEHPPADEVDRSKAQEVAELPTPPSPVKKLKMPNININVQALLPGSGGLPKFQKVQVPAAPPLQEAEVSVPGTKPPSAYTPNINEESNSTGRENGLQHVNKTRARGPARRRPSTRQGRRENYAKSVLEDVHQSTSAEVAPTSNATASSKTPTLPKLVKSFLDSDDEDEDLFGTAKIVSAMSQSETSAKPATPAPAAKAMAAPLPSEPPEDHVKPKAHTVPMSRPAKLFDESDDDDDLFASAAVAAPVPSVQAKVSSKTTAASLFSSDEDEDFKLPAKTAPKKNIAPIQSSKSTSLFSDDEDDDDLFGGAATSKQAKPQPRGVAKPAASKTRTAATIPASSGDNPLADLLGFK
ncbi:WASH complex subunit 2 [Drosophila guanche]|uniref:Blast:WASH complex subunit FAM21 homolog n=1 Tax=Drosophila guanche TaxID=7266 RepID=A0A3B0JMI3_DROGU|nr:WASH complex subunit 2 [Drosophila guanche]SPP73831.1 blast:WASH complex subunit FAM21 homolog [Drosophila guanche]